jgi:polysaccharide biosynthesis transport protein
VMDDPTSPLAEAYRSLRTALQFSTSGGAPRSLLITSSRPGEGKSTTTACIALNFGLLGLRVLVIDGDLRNPSQHRILSLDNGEGLSNYLSGTTPPGISGLVDGDARVGIVKQSKMAGVSVMTTGPLPPNPAELLAGPRFRALLATAAESFDMVIIDGPPIMGLADAPILGSLADGTMLVVEGAKTRRAVVRDAVKRLHFVRARVVGVVLNKCPPKNGAGYGYGYGYSYGYGADEYIYDQKPDSILNPPQDAA